MKKSHIAAIRRRIMDSGVTDISVLHYAAHVLFSVVKSFYPKMALNNTQLDQR